MRILVDGDACPNKTEIAALAKKYHIPMLVYIDYAHELVNDYYEVIQCAIGHDSVDLVTVSYTHLESSNLFKNRSNLCPCRNSIKNDFNGFMGKPRTCFIL